jgi:hypothetical protein
MYKSPEIWYNEPSSLSRVLQRFAPSEPFFEPGTQLLFDGDSSRGLASNNGGLFSLCGLGFAELKSLEEV